MQEAALGRVSLGGDYWMNELDSMGKTLKRSRRGVLYAQEAKDWALNI
jgi:hypothetical protein